MSLNPQMRMSLDLPLVCGEPATPKIGTAQANPEPQMTWRRVITFTSVLLD